MTVPAPTPIRLAAVLCLSALALGAGCSRPQPADTEPPPEPRTATAPAAQPAAQATGLRDAIQEPLDRAEAVKQSTEDAARAQREAIDAATGG